MHLILDGHGPLHAQLTRALKSAIKAGALANGSRLPPTRQLARELRLSRNTIIAAYDQLQAEGVLDARVGSGSYVNQPFETTVASKPDVVAADPQSSFSRRARKFYDPNSRPVGAPAAGTRYSFQYGLPLTNPVLTSAWAREVARAAAYTPMNYPNPQGLVALREALVDYLGRRRGVHVTPSDILIVHGTQEAITLVARVLLDVGDEVVIEEPQYIAIRRVLQINGARLRPVTVDRDGMREDLLPDKAPKLICVTPSHQFPSGAVLSGERRAALLEYARRHACWILEDDYDGEFRYDQKPLSALRAMDESDRVIHVGTFSKLLFPSLRLGYLVMPRSLRNDFRTAKWANDLGTSAIEQAALAHFMMEGGFERHLRRASRELQERRNALLKGLDACSDGRLEIAGSHAGMHLVVWMKDATMADGERFLHDARRAGLGLHPIQPHYMEPPDRFGLLLGFCGLSTAQIREAMPLFHQCLDRLGPRRP